MSKTQKNLNLRNEYKPLTAAPIEQPSGPPSTPLEPNTLERQIAERLADYPDSMSRTDFRTACRIGTRTSEFHRNA